MSKSLDTELNDRDKAILRTIVQLYVLRASPVGSKYLSDYLKEDLKISPATIRNVMAKLEECEVITHPHTSAGRIPTDKGYRIYVDNLMEQENLSGKELKELQKNLEGSDAPKVLNHASKILGMLSRYLSIVQIPNLKELKVQKIEVVSLTSTRILVVVALDSNNVHTVTLEADFDIDPDHIGEITSYINEKVSGKPLSFLRNNFSELIEDFDKKDMPLVRLFVDSVDKIFEGQSSQGRILISGAKNLIHHPEFENPENIRSVIEIIEDEDIIIHLLEKTEDITEKDIHVMIGQEMEHEALNDYSLITSAYKLGAAGGAIGLIGPKRMNYSRMISLVQHVSETLSANY